jgi:hypothetical protein
MRWAYRARQFLMRLFARRQDIDQGLVRQVLSDRAVGLFARMPVGDQLHAVQVLRELRRLGNLSADLEQAALLHDVGKAEGSLTLLRRAVIVLLQAVSPGLLQRLARDDPRSWRYPFAVHLQHAERGAHLCQQAGCSPMVAALVRYHDAPSPAAIPEPALVEAVSLLRLADDKY